MRKRNAPHLNVIQNSEEDALRAYFRKLYMVEKYLLQVMLENDIQVHCKLIHTDSPRQYQGRVRFNGAIAIGMNPYSGLPSVLFTPLGAVDLSKGFATQPEAADTVFKILYHDLSLTELAPLPSIVPGVSQRVFSMGRDPYGNPLPTAKLITSESQEHDPALGRYIANRDEAHQLWERVRLQKELSPQEQIMLSIPRKTTHLQAVA